MNSVRSLNSEWTVREKFPGEIFLVFLKKSLETAIKVRKKNLREKKNYEVDCWRGKTSPFLKTKKITFKRVFTFSNLEWSILQNCCGQSPTLSRKTCRSSGITVLTNRTRWRRWSERRIARCTWTKRWTLLEVSKHFVWKTTRATKYKKVSISVKRRHAPNWH